MAQVDVRALANNLAEVRRLIGGGVAVLAVVKADAYGHGAKIVARVLSGAGVAHFGVATVGEGIELRRAGIAGDILVLGGVWEEELAGLLQEGLTPVLTDLRLVEALAQRAKQAGRVASVHLKIDTGMTRLGIAPEEAAQAAHLIKRHPSLFLEGVLTHFCDAENVATPATAKQLETFRGTLQAVLQVLPNVKWIHAANSAGVLSRPDAHFNMVRPGLMLYGVPPSPQLADAARLLPVMRLITRIARVRRVPPGTPVGYGSTFVTSRETLIATLAVGYADGYSRALSNRGWVLIRGKRAPVVGRVCMDHTMIDVTDCDPVTVGEEAVLWGRQREAFLSVSEVAQWAGTIPYEMLAGLGRRVPRVERNWLSGPV